MTNREKFAEQILDIWKIDTYLRQSELITESGCKDIM